MIYNTGQPKKTFFLIMIIILLFLASCQNTSVTQQKTTQPETESGIISTDTSKWTGIWQYTDGPIIAQIRIENETVNNFDFVFFAIEGPEHRQGDFYTYAHGTKNLDNTASFSVPFYGLSTLKSAEGILTLNENILTIRYTSIERKDGYFAEPPTEFTRISNDKANEVLKNMPYNSYEPQLMNYLQTMTLADIDGMWGKPAEIVQRPAADGASDGEIIETRTYSTGTRVILEYSSWPNGNPAIKSCETTDPNIEFLRGIKIGDTLNSIIVKFPNENNEIMDTRRGKVKDLYGEKGYILYDESNNMIFLRYMNDILHYDLYFDKNDKLIKVFAGPTY